MLDVDEPFDAATSRVVVPLKQNRGAIEALLTSLSGMFDETRAAGGAGGAALRCAYSAARSIGGKLLLYQCGRVPHGVGAMPDRQAAGAEPHSLLLPHGDAAQFYKTLALDCSRAQLAVDVTLVGSQFSDVATFNALSQITGGELRRYARLDAAQLVADLERCVTRESGLEAVMRIRCSKGLSVTTYHGNLFVRSTDLLALPSVDADKAFAVQLKVDSSAASQRSLALQAALLYTTTSGRRRIRVLTVCLPVVTTLAQLFRHTSLPAVVNLMTKMAIKKALETNLADAREALVNKCIDILAVYRRAFASPQTPPTQLVLPDALKGLPLAVLALVKCPMLRSGMEVSADERATLMYVRALVKNTSCVSHRRRRLYVYVYM
jgi:protein transport protein SEC24